ncbi:MAG TPA: AAA family ATPase, partial [Candidatus Limnocylindrales bacterium]|nr:AAA family ATPase [Candidatus Limnocylindrales bacterium]
MDPQAKTLTAGRLWGALSDSVGRAMVGAGEPLRLLASALLVGGHVLVEDVPGVGKTLLAKSFAKSLGLSFSRVQGTPDLLPSDVTGSSVLDGGDFRFIQGPIFSNVVLFDEINRATPRTQSALLEAMQEKQVSVDGQTRALPRPFV